MKPLSRFRQQGVALITALLIVTLATLITVAMTSRQQLDIRRTQNILEDEQLRFYLHGIEAWAGKILADDHRDSDIDHPGEDWAMQLPPVPVDNGQLTGHIEDLQGRFNLNSLLDGDGRVNAETLQILQRLLVLLQISPTLTDAITDWIDTDLEAYPPYGAEDGSYLALEPPYRAANRRFTDITELRLLVGMDEESFQRLAPHVTALPETTTINLNTASAEVIMALAEGITPAEAEQFVARSKKQGWRSVEEALEHPALKKNGLSDKGLGVASSYFMVMSHLSIGRLQQHHASILSRQENGTSRVLMRFQNYL